MITITIFQNQGQNVGLESFGHAQFAEAGNDIVCAAVSILVINTINSIEQFTADGMTLDVKDSDATGVVSKHFKKHNDNYLKFMLTEDVSRESKVLMDSLVLGLEEIKKQYGDSYLTLNFKEV